MRTLAFLSHQGMALPRAGVHRRHHPHQGQGPRQGRALAAAGAASSPGSGRSSTRTTRSSQEGVIVTLVEGRPRERAAASAGITSRARLGRSAAPMRASYAVNAEPNMTVRTRFAPSPTGYLHIGGVRTALFNWLLRQPARRPVHPAHRRHRRRTQSPRSAAADPRRLPLARHHLGRRARGRRAVRAVFPVAARPALSRRGHEAARQRARVSRLHDQGRDSTPCASRPRARRRTYVHRGTDRNADAGGSAARSTRKADHGAPQGAGRTARSSSTT